MASHLSESERCIRRLRKKLRQIENLEALDRHLNEEESEKVSRKDDIRKELSALLKKEDEMKRGRVTGIAAAGSHDQETSQPAKAAKKASAAADDVDLTSCSSSTRQKRSSTSETTLDQGDQLEISVPLTCLLYTSDAADE